jgi:long-chain fatty acid transport protein
MRKPIVARMSVALMGVLAGGSVNAGSFSLYTESNGYSIGNFAAGVAAEAYDASTGWYNPAGLALIHKQQAILGGVGVLPSASLSGTTQFNTFQGGGLYHYQQSFQNLEGGESGFVPSFYYAKPLSKTATFGFSVTVPFGLSSSWDPASPLRYAGTLSSLQSVNISPEVGWKFNDHLAFGVGPDFQYASVKFNNILGSPALLAVSGDPMAWDSSSTNQGDSWGFGFHTGLMMMLNDDHTRLGLNYQSRVNHTFRGSSELNGPLADPSGNFESKSLFTSDNLISNDIQFPDIVTLSGYQDVNDKLAILGSVVFSGWDGFKTIELDNVAALNDELHPALVDFVSTEHYRNAWRFALGVNYTINPQWMLRAGGGYDQTPTVNAERTVRMPDADRWALSVGAHYQPRAQWIIDAGYTYLQSINHSTPLINKTIVLNTDNNLSVNADGHAYVHVLGAQIRWLIDKP